MSIPPYIPGLALAIMGGTGLLATLDASSPTDIANYTDTQIIRIYAAASTLAIAWMGRWIVTRMLAVIEANTAAMQHHTAVMGAQLDDYRAVGQRAMDAAFHDHSDKPKPRP